MSIPIAQSESMKGSSFVRVLGEDGNPMMFDQFPSKSSPPSSSGLISYLFSTGTEHTIIGEINLHDRYIFKSDEQNPLRFRCDLQYGYVYVDGKGTVTMPDEKTVELGQ